MPDAKHDDFEIVQKPYDVFGYNNDYRSKRSIYASNSVRDPQSNSDLPKEIDINTLSVGIVIGTITCIIFVVIMRWIAGFIVWTIIAIFEFLLFASEFQTVI